MRFLAIGLAAAFVALLVGKSATACDSYAAATISLRDAGQTTLARATTTDTTAAKKKPGKKKAAIKKKKPKVEYMRAAPMPPGAK